MREKRKISKPLLEFLKLQNIEYNFTYDMDMVWYCKKSTDTSIPLYIFGFDDNRSPPTITMVCHCSMTILIGLRKHKNMIC